MRYLFGTLALAAAIIIVGYSATTLFTAAYTASAEPWQQMLNGTGAAAIVVWEATALILIGATWHRGYKPVAVLSTVLLVVAMAVTLTWEMRTVIGGRADKFASREVDASKLKGIDSDMEWLRKRRDTLTTKPSSKDVRKEMEWISTRIESLDRDRSSARAVKEVMPEAAWSARMLGGTEQLWNDILTALPLLFWMLARVAAAPLAVAALVGRRREPVALQGRAEATGAIIIPPMPCPAPSLSLEAFVKPSEPEPVTPPEPPKGPRRDTETVPAPAAAEAPRPTEPFVPRVVENVPPKPRSKAERMESVDAVTRRWIKARGVIKASIADGIAAAAVYQDYLEFAGKSAVGPSHFGRSVKRCGFPTKSTAAGAKYGLKISGNHAAVA